MADFAQILIRAKDETKGAFDSAARNMRGLEAGASKLKGMIGTIGIGAGLSAAGFAAFAKSTIDAADGLNDLSQRTGVSVKTLADWKLAATLADTSLDSLAKGVQRLTLSIGQAEAGGKTQAEALKTLGVTARDPQQAFEQLADAVAKSNDPIKTNAALNDVLGRSYAELLPLLQGGAKGLRESAAASQSFSDAMVTLAPSAAKLNDQLDTLKINAAGAAASILADLVPSLNEYIAVGREVINNGTLLDKVRFFGLGNASDELVNRVRINLAASAGWMDKLTASAARANQLGGGGNAATREKPAGAGTKTDPLAGLLGSTDIGRTQEYNRLLGLLDARFAGGQKNAELYAQAVEKLNEQFGRSQIDVFDSGSFQTASKDVAAFIREQQDAINGLNSEMAQDGVRAAQEYESALAALIADTTVIKTQDLHANIAILDQALMDGAISADIHAEALAKLTEGVPEKVEDAANAFRDFGMIMVSSLEEAIVSGAELGDVLKGLEQDLLKMGTRMLITDPLSKAVKDFDFGSISLPGSDQNLLGSFASLFGFDGGGYTGDGARTGGLDGKGGFLAVMHPRETVVDHTKGQSLGSTTVIMNITTPDANSFRASQGQITAQYASALQRARRNM